jgi:membrane protein
MLRALRVPVGWRQLLGRTYRETVADDCLGLAAQLAYCFFLALFPALLFLVALISFIPIENLIGTITSTLARVAPGEVIAIVQNQLMQIGKNQSGGLLTIGVLGAIWSSSAGVAAIVDALNQVYDIRERRPWWKVRLIALGLTIALTAFVVVSTALVLVGPALAERVAAWFHLGAVFTWTWTILQWPVVFALVSLGIATVYYVAPDAKQEWIWITPGSILATFLWLLTSIAFRFYVTNFGSYNATYGAVGGVIVLLLWFYVSGLAILVGAELNAEVEHASPYGKDPGERAPDEKKAVGRLAERTWRERPRADRLQPAAAAAGNCDIDRDLPAASRPPLRTPRATDWLLSALVLGRAAFSAYRRLRILTGKGL